MKLVVFICFISCFSYFVHCSSISRMDESKNAKEDDSNFDYVEIYDSYVIPRQWERPAEEDQHKTHKTETREDKTEDVEAVKVGIDEAEDVKSQEFESQEDFYSIETQGIGAPETEAQINEDPATNEMNSRSENVAPKPILYKNSLTLDTPDEQPHEIVVEEDGWLDDETNEHSGSKEENQDQNQNQGQDQNQETEQDRLENEVGIGIGMEFDYNDIDSLHKRSFPCWECDSRTDGERCLHTEYMTDVCYSEIGQCYTAYVHGDVIRGCVGDGVFPNIASTKAAPEESIKLCNNDRLCNDDKIDDTCIVCHDDKCENSFEKACSLGEPSGCYLSINENNKYERGCLRDLNEEKQQKCVEKGSLNCQSCFTRNCNEKSSFDQHCHFCNGTTDAGCQRGGMDGINITCIGYSSVCITGIDAKGFTHRQCSLDEEKDKQRFPNGYDTCLGDYCNGRIFPEDRLRCYRCAKGRECDNPAADLILGETCRIHPDECYVYGKEDGKMHRGCMSDRSTSKRLCENNEKDCFKCNGTNCNYLQSFQLNNPIEELSLNTPKANNDDSSEEKPKRDDQDLVSDFENAYDEIDSNAPNGNNSGNNNDGELESKPNNSSQNEPSQKPGGNSADIPSFCLLTVIIPAILTQLLSVVMKF